MPSGEEGIASFKFRRVANAQAWDHAKEAPLRRSLVENRRREDRYGPTNPRPRRIHERRDNSDGNRSAGNRSDREQHGDEDGDNPQVFTWPPYPAMFPPLPTKYTSPQTPAPATRSSSSSNPTKISQSATRSISASPHQTSQTSEPQPQKGVDPPVSQSSISPATGKFLIAVGSIGCFVLMCFIIWVIWWSVKRLRRRRSHMDNGGRVDVLRRVIPECLAARVSFLQARICRNLGDSGPARAPPSRYSGTGAQGAAEGPLGSFDSQDKIQVAQQRAVGGAEGPVPILPRTNSLSMGTLTGVQDGPVTGTPIITIGQQQIARPSPTEAAQYATVNSTEALGTSDIEGTARSRMGPGIFFNQSELARQPSDAYDPARRQVNRASELSSLSSGFGDGDMMLPDGVAVVLSRPLPVAASPRQPNYLAPRFSWMRSAGENRSSRGSSRSSGSNGGLGGSSGSGHDTVYTQVSEDTVPRFRTISSWVNQQTSRVEPSLPGVHKPPPEQSSGTENPEVARPVDEVLGDSGGDNNDANSPVVPDAGSNAAATSAPKSAEP